MEGCFYTVFIIFLIFISGIIGGIKIQQSYDKEELCKVLSVNVNDYTKCISSDIEDLYKLVKIVAKKQYCDIECSKFK